MCFSDQMCFWRCSSCLCILNKACPIFIHQILIQHPPSCCLLYSFWILWLVEVNLFIALLYPIYKESNGEKYENTKSNSLKSDSWQRFETNQDIHQHNGLHNNQTDAATNQFLTLCQKMFFSPETKHNACVNEPWVLLVSILLYLMVCTTSDKCYLQRQMCLASLSLHRQSIGHQEKREPAIPREGECCTHIL